MHKTIAVIGHVDHGKTALVKALTGTDTDRLEEERKRGLSIVLGFANQQTSEGWLHFIDAPGHADFIQTAAMGLSGADAILLVVDMSEGPSLQTIEHLKLAQLFGIEDAVVALSKSDLAQAPSGDSDDISEFLSDYGFGAPPIIACSSHTMEGIEHLKSALRNLLLSKSSRPSPAQLFLPVDRVFSAAGVGTVVTGTLLGGDLRVDDAIILQPTGRACSIRGLQIAGQSSDKACAGTRVAVNLRGIKPQNIKKGDALCTADQGKPSRLFDVLIDPPSDGTRPLTHMEQVTVLHGTCHSPARIRLLEKGKQAALVAQLEFKSDQIGFSGQRFVVRRPASFETVCGGQILDAEATLAKRKKERHVAVLRAAANGNVLETAKALSDRDDGTVDLNLLSRLARRNTDACSATLGSDFILDGNGMAYSVARIEAVKASLVEAIQAFHHNRPLRPHAPLPSSNPAFSRIPSGLLSHAVQSLLEENTIETRLDGIAMAGHTPSDFLDLAERKIYQGTVEQLRRTGLMPEISLDTKITNSKHADLLDFMVWNGEVVRLYNHALNQTVILHTDAVQKAISALKEAFTAGQAFKTGEAREALSTNRKNIVPLLEHLDAIGVTKRDGNVRVVNTAHTLD